MIEKPTRKPKQTTPSHFCEAIVSEVAASTGTAPLELPPIYEAIDIDALEQLFSSRESDRSRPTGRVEFMYNDCLVEVESTGNVHVSPDHNSIQSEVDTYTQTEGSETALCESIVTAVSVQTEKNLRDMEPLYSVIDSDALSKICEGAHQRAMNPDALEVQFHYQGCQVTVEGDGRVKVDQHRSG